MKESRKIKVLVIEDDPFTSMVYTDQLNEVSGFDFSFVIHENLNDGLAALQNDEFDVLLLDLNLPDSDYENTISKIPGINFRVPVIVMTSTDNELLALKTMTLGGQDYLLKSRLDKDLLTRSVLYSMERHQLKKQLHREKKLNEELLLNILPEEVANELKEKGEAEAKLFEDVTVLFTDFKGFTQMSEKVTPKQLVKDLHECFSAFDQICEKYGIEKIKTIGDAYMAAGGLPTPCSNHAENVVRAAFEMRDFVEIGKQRKIANNLPFFEIRIGIHTGPVVAGIVGVKKFQYDIWGDTVNTAARIESSGEVGKVNISQTTYERLKETWTKLGSGPEFEFEPRGKIEVKGKGEIEMYFVSTSEI